MNKDEKYANMQIDWDFLPPEANWLAQDADGRYFWHEYKPEAGLKAWGNRSKYGSDGIRIKNWKETLQKRPKANTKLIAAAPEMLEVLVELADSALCENALMYKARAVIAKAQGVENEY